MFGGEKEPIVDPSIIHPWMVNLTLKTIGNRLLKLARLSNLSQVLAFVLTHNFKTFILMWI